MLVSESLNDILKPKTKEEIDKEFIPLIDKFLNIPEEYFRLEFVYDNDDIKSYAEGDNIFYLTDKDTLDDIVLSLVHDVNFGKNGEVVYRNKKLNNLFNDPNIEKEFIPILRDKLAEKFNIEY